MKPHRLWCAEKTHCKHGHEFNEANTRIKDRGWKVERVCRACEQRRYQERLERDKASRRRLIAAE